MPSIVTCIGGIQKEIMYNPFPKEAFSPAEQWTFKNAIIRQGNHYSNGYNGFFSKGKKHTGRCKIRNGEVHYSRLFHKTSKMDGCLN